MKQGTLIIIGAIIVILLIAIWVYLLFFGTPKSANDIFSDFNLGGEETGQEIIDPIIEPEEEPVVNMERPRLRQLTTKPVIGFVETQTSTTSPIFVSYAEAGTGHIYTINLESGEEERVSNTTVAEASVATFSPDGKTVAVRARNDRRANELTIGSIENGELTTRILKEQVYDFTLTSSSTLLYTVRDTTGLIARELNLLTNASSTVFSVPFFDATISWGKTSTDSHVVYPKTSYLLEGYLYTFTKGTMARLPASGYGLSALNGRSYITYTATRNYVPATSIYNKSTGERIASSLTLLPEKCGADISRTQWLWCGAVKEEQEFEFPDNWYRGEVSFSDSIWLINLEDGGAELVVNPMTEPNVRRGIDVTNMTAGESGYALYFINKNDNTLWMYELES
jgi:hypothetical protein